jgi:phage gp36-like protein
MKTSPTVTSFYTLAEKKRNNVQVEREKGSNPGIPANIRKTWFVNRAADARPYLCLPAKLTQTPFNKFTIGFVLLAVLVQLFCAVVFYSLDVTQDSILSSCISSFSKDASISLLPDTVADIVLSSIERSVDTLNDQATEDLNSAISNFGSSAETYVDHLSEVYSQTVKAVAQSAYKSTNNASQSITNIIKKELESAIDLTDKEISNVTSALKKLEDEMESSSVLFQNVDLGSAEDLNLDRFKSINVESTLNSTLVSINSRSTKFNDFDKIVSNAKTTLKNMSKNSTMTAPKTNFNATSIGLPKTSKLDICPVGSKIEAQFRQVKSSINTVKRNCLASMIVLAVIFILLSAGYEKYKWKRTMEQATALETPGGFWDPVENVHAAEEPLSTKLGFSTSLLLGGNEKSRTFIRWFIDYFSAPPSLNLMLIGSWFLIAFVCQATIIHPISSADLDENTLTSTSTSSDSHSSITTWIGHVNTALERSESKINSDLSNQYKQSLDNTYETLNVYQNSLASKFREFFGDYGDSLSIPITLSNTIVFPTEVTVPSIKLPRVDPSDIPSIKSVSGSLDITDSVSRISSTLNYLSETTMQLGIAFLSVWTFLFLASLVYALCMNKFSSN